MEDLQLHFEDEHNYTNTVTETPDPSALAVQLLTQEEEEELSLWGLVLCSAGALFGGAMLTAMLTTFWRWLLWSNLLLLILQFLLLAGIWTLLFAYCVVRLLTNWRNRKKNRALRKVRADYQRRLMDEILADKRDARIRKNKALDSALRVKETHLYADERGNRPVIRVGPKDLLVPPTGQINPNVPHTYHYHNTAAPGVKAIQEEGLPLLGAPKVPTGRELLMDGTVERALREGYIILGVNDEGGMARLKIKRCFSTLVSGLPSVGKSTTVFWIAGQLVIIGARIWVVDAHMYFQDEEGNKSLAAELADLADSFVFPPCDGETQQVLYRVRFMYQELRKRQKPGYIVRAKDMIIGIMDEFNSIADSIDPALVVVTHEGRDLNFAQTLALIEREGRKYGLHFMLIGHKWARQDIGGDNAVRTNATTYLCHKLNDQHQAELLLGSGQGKKVLALTVGSYWITGPTWNAEPAKITTPATSAADLPVFLDLKRRGVQVLKEGNVVESTLAPAVSEERAVTVSEDIAEDIAGSSPSSSISQPRKRITEELEKPADTTEEEITLTPELQAKMHLVLDMDAQHKGQNEIIIQIWGHAPNTREGRTAADDLRKIRAYLAYLHRKHLRLGQ